MNDGDLHHDEGGEPGTIGVGMGGSCPTCRAPVDLGQEFCLECGSPIRFTPRQKRPASGAARPAAAVPATPSKKRGSGFPWLPFLVVLALVGGGVAFALVDDDAATSKDPATSTEDPLPTITSETQPDSTSSTSTTTLEDCDPTRPLDGTQPAVVDPGADPNALGGTGEQIPALGSDGTTGDMSSGFDQDVPSIEPTESSDAAVTVDQNGNLCPSSGSTGGTTAPPVDPSTQPGGTTTDGTNNTTSSSGDWPAGKEGWTVIVAGYPTQERAAQRAADVQEDGYDDAGVLFSTDFASLCPGIYVVFSGVFDTDDEAGERLADLSAKPDYAGMYVREVRTSGSRPSGCTAVQS